MYYADCHHKTQITQIRSQLSLNNSFSGSGILEGRFTTLAPRTAKTAKIGAKLCNESKAFERERFWCVCCDRVLVSLTYLGERSLETDNLRRR